MYKKKILLSTPRTGSAKKLFEPYQSSFTTTNAKTDRFDEINSLRQTLRVLTEERNLLLEYKKAAEPKICKLKENLSKSEIELEKKNAEIKEIKSFYESEIECMQDYANLLKNIGRRSDLEEQLKNEKTRSMTFYRALLKKQEECEQNHKGMDRIKELEENLNTLEGKLGKLKNCREDERQFMSDSKGFFVNKSSEVLEDVVKKLKVEVKDRMKECVDQAVNNFEVFNVRIGKMEEKLLRIGDGKKIGYDKRIEELKSVLERMKKEKIELQRGLEESRMKVEEAKLALESVKKEKLELQKTLEKNYKENIKDITSYEEEIERQKRKIKALVQEIHENKVSADEKIKKVLNENYEMSEKIEFFEKNRSMFEDLSEAMKILKKNEDILEQVNEENAKLQISIKTLQKSLKDSQQTIEVSQDENAKLRTELKISENIISDLKTYLNKLESDIKNLLSLKQSSALLPTTFSLPKKDFSDSLQTSDKTMSLENCPNFSIPATSALNKTFPNLQQEIESLKSLFTKEVEMRNKDSKLSESLLVSSTQEENSLIRKELYRLREEKQELLVTNEDLCTEKKVLSALVKDLQTEMQKINEEKQVLLFNNEHLCPEKEVLSALVKNLQTELQKLREEKNEVETDRSRVVRELKLAKDVIFHNKLLEPNESSVVIDSEKENLVAEMGRVQKRIEEVSENLSLEREQHENTLKKFNKADKRIESLTASLQAANEAVVQKDAEIENYHKKIENLAQRFQELKQTYQTKLEYCENVISVSSSKEKIHLQNLNRIQEYEKLLTENEEKLEQKQVYIEELQEALDEYKEEMIKSEEKIKNLEFSLARISKSLSENFEMRKKLIEFNSPIKEQYSLDRTIKEESSKEFADIEKLEKIRTNLEILIDQLVTFEYQHPNAVSEDRKKILQLIKNEVQSQSMFNLDEIKVKVETLQHKIKELRNKYRILIQNNDLIVEENFVLKEKLKLVAEERSLNENAGFDSLSLEEKQVSMIESDTDMKIKTLEDENARLKLELENFKDSTLGYSASEEDVYKKTGERGSDLTTEEKKQASSDDNILILVNGESISSDLGISYTDNDTSGVFYFDSK